MEHVAHAGHRFERGVDPSTTPEHVERITQLVLEICGGQAAVLDDQVVQLPKAQPVTLRVARAAKVIGIEDWHINSAESNFFEYGSKYSGQLAKSEGPFSASDHDPVLVAIQYPLPPAGVLSLESAAANVEEGNTLALSVARRDG